MPNPIDTNQSTRRIKADEDGDRQFILHPDNDDLFVQTGKQIIEACRLNISVNVWLDELRSMLDRVRLWASARAASVRACFAAPRGGKIVLFFVPARDQFDFDLADGLAELNRELVQQSNVGMIEIHQIPWNEIERFIQPQSARAVFGEQPTTHSTVDA